MSILLKLRLWLLNQQWFTSTLLPAIPRPLRWGLRKVYFVPVDLAERLLGHRDQLVPPRSENFTGSADGFRRSGQRLVEQLISLGGLQPDSKILDVGCGMGRLAVALTNYLTIDGSYDGLDIVESGIDWCDANIGSKHPNFNFALADVFNAEYHPKGRFKASEYRFPYPADMFDLVVLVSVFTHMLPEEMVRYVSEIARVLRSRGRCFATYFLINDESQDLMHTHRSALRFKHHIDDHWVVNPKVPALSVGYDESYVRELYRTFFAETSIHYGGWCGRPPLWAPEAGLGDQDVLVATKQ